MHLIILIIAAVIIVLVADHFLQSKKGAAVETDAKTVVADVESDVTKIEKAL
jgi:hypothetical protein